MPKMTSSRSQEPCPELPELPSPVPEHVLDAQITAERARRYRQVLLRRTDRIVVVIEDCHDPHNATAVTRTCDAFGISRLHVVTADSPYKVNRRVSGGSHHHLDIRPHASIDEAYASLREEGFAIAVATLADNALTDPRLLTTSLETKPLALVFGNEHAGASEKACEQADFRFQIPMVGFAQSLNVSVAVAITLYTLREQALATIAPGDLSAAEQQRLYDEWIRRHRGEAGEKYLRRIGRGDEPLDVYTAG
jgi:tRNA (guanosine-2'-O-)-methyltransferase